MSEPVDFKAIEEKALAMLEDLLQRGEVEVAMRPTPKPKPTRSTRKRECVPRA